MMDLPTRHVTRARTRTGLVIVSTMMSAAIISFASQGCRTAPVSGRKQLVLIPEAQEIQLGVEAYQQTLAEEPISTDQQVTEMVERVGRRIAAVANKPEYDWEFRVIAKDVQNAFALPGGKVAIYEGILPVCQTEAGLAVVMSHEVAHALARHGGERMSQQSVVSGVGTVINAVSQKRADEATSEKIMQVYGASSQYGVILPFSRKHESEADAIGLILMAKAGYDPSVAPEFWERFSASNGPKPPEWLSTHPADTRRAADLRALLPEAMKYYQTAQNKVGMGEVIPVAPLASAVTIQPKSASPQNGQPKTDSQLTPATYMGTVSSLTGNQTGKKQTVQHAMHTELATGPKDSALQQASAEASQDNVHWSHQNVDTADFQLPVKATSDEPANATPEENDAAGWTPSSEPNPFE